MIKITVGIAALCRVVVGVFILDAAFINGEHSRSVLPIVPLVGQMGTDQGKEIRLVCSRTNENQANKGSTATVTTARIYAVQVTFQ
jgi:hypothetical protein